MAHGVFRTIVPNVIAGWASQIVPSSMNTLHLKQTEWCVRLQICVPWKCWLKIRNRCSVICAAATGRKFLFALQYIVTNRKQPYLFKMVNNRAGTFNSNFKYVGESIPRTFDCSMPESSDSTEKKRRESFSMRCKHLWVYFKRKFCDSSFWLTVIRSQRGYISQPIFLYWNRCFF